MVREVASNSGKTWCFMSVVAARRLKSEKYNGIEVAGVVGMNTSQNRLPDCYNVWRLRWVWKASINRASSINFGVTI